MSISGILQTRPGPKFLPQEADVFRKAFLVMFKDLGLPGLASRVLKDLHEYEGAIAGIIKFSGSHVIMLVDAAVAHGWSLGKEPGVVHLTKGDASVLVDSPTPNGVEPHRGYDVVFSLIDRRAPIKPKSTLMALDVDRIVSGLRWLNLYIRDSRHMAPQDLTPSHVLTSLEPLRILVPFEPSRKPLYHLTANPEKTPNTVFSCTLSDRRSVWTYLADQLFFGRKYDVYRLPSSVVEVSNPVWLSKWFKWVSKNEPRLPESVLDASSSLDDAVNNVARGEQEAIVFTKHKLVLSDCVGHGKGKDWV